MIDYEKAVLLTLTFWGLSEVCYNVFIVNSDNWGVKNGYQKNRITYGWDGAHSDQGAVYVLIFRRKSKKY